MRVAWIQYVIFWLNYIPKEGQVQAPKEIIMGEQRLDCKVLCKLPFGAYKFLSLTTGEVIMQRKWMELPV
jgi:hypothetical protein